MVQRIFKFLLIMTLVAVAACGGHKPKEGNKTFITEGERRPKTPVTGSQEVPETSPFYPREELPETTAPLLLQDEVKVEVPQYRLPEDVRVRVAEQIPQFIQPNSKTFEVVNHRLNVNVKTSSMTFTGTLKIPSKQDETFELSCKFDQSKSWACGNMYPTNPAVARERRLQGVANCTDQFRCDRVGVELFVVIDGKIESQLFQSTKFEMRRATSGDEVPNFVTPEKPAVPTQPVPPGPIVQEKPKKERERPRMEKLLTDEELRQILDDSNAAVEIIAPQPVPPPVGGEFSIPDIEKLRPVMGTGVPNQAIGAHYEGRLESPATLLKSGAGYKVRNGADRSFGTDSMIGLIRDAAAIVDKKYPGKSPIMIADISQKYGGRLGNRSGRFHASHQTGLDADIAFPSKRSPPDLWPASGNGGISDNLDEDRLWLFVTSLVCAEKNPVIAIFIDTSIKKHMCNWVKKREGLDDLNSCAAKTLRAMKYSPGHHDHIHLRLRCPGNADCRDATVSLGRNTGC